MHHDHRFTCGDSRDAHDSRDVSSLASPSGRLVRELRRRFFRGEPARAEELLANAPDLWQQPEAALDVVYEEYCLRQGRNEADAGPDLLARFPQWRPQLAVMFECHRMLAADERQTRPPAVGDTVEGFRLRAELGGGSRGVVFLATQSTLADRPVVVKITPDRGAEHLSLARVQHTHIMPLYSAHSDHARRERILCMPYFGGTTFDRVLRAVRETPLERRTGRQLLTVLDEHSAAAMASIPATGQPTLGHGPVRRALERASYLQAVCLIGACLAEALQYAHERGLVHLDVKPSNVLLAADGQPLLLDFHLARSPYRVGDEAPAGFGGTLAYMPPEQAAAHAAAEAGRTPPLDVGPRADLFALGATLYEALGGSVPFEPDRSPTLAELNPHVSRDLSDLVARCLANHAEDRYSNATALATDLRRCLSQQPSLGVPRRGFRAGCHALFNRAMPAVRRWLLLAGWTVLVAISMARLSSNSPPGSDQLANRHAHCLEEIQTMAVRSRELSDVSTVPADQRELLARHCRELFLRQRLLNFPGNRQDELADNLRAIAALHDRLMMDSK